MASNENFVEYLLDDSYNIYTKEKGIITENDIRINNDIQLTQIN